MNILDKLERKLGRYAIPGLMRFVIIGTAVAYVLYLINPEYLSYLYLDPQLVLKGQVWRLITFIFIPTNVGNPLFLLISLYFYYFIGKALEDRWGAFRFNVFYFTGIICAILSSFLLGIYGIPDYLNETLFLAFATLFPEVTVLIFFILPVKVKWLGWLSAVMLLVQFITAAGWRYRVYILLSLVNYFLFFGPELFQMIRRPSLSRISSRLVQSQNACDPIVVTEAGRNADRRDSQLRKVSVPMLSTPSGRIRPYA